VAQQSTAEPFAIADVRVFDGERVLPRATVVVRRGRIASVSARRPARLPAAVVDGRGRTLLPGLIDAHVHTCCPSGEERVLTEALRWGVTTALDMFGDPGSPARLRALRGRPDLADTRAAGAGATAPKGHGTEYGFAAPTISSPDSADAFVAARVAEGSAVLKIIIAPGGAARPIPTLDSTTVAALVTAARRRGLLTVAHVDRARDAAMALGAGVDGLAHVWVDTGAVPAASALAARRRAFVVPTLVVRLEDGTVGGESRALATDPRIRRWLSDSAYQAMLGPSWVRGVPDSVVRRWRADTARVRPQAYAAVADLRRAGVRILAGSDAPNLAMGPVFLHREIELLVQAGLTPAEALRAATSATADAFGLRDRGRIRPGQRADLLLLDGDPTRDVTATRGIMAVWKGGVRVRRESVSGREPSGR
jgi:imidazolonepropionase-like amidohydrolase